MEYHQDPEPFLERDYEEMRYAAARPLWFAATMATVVAVVVISHNLAGALAPWLPPPPRVPPGLLSGGIVLLFAMAVARATAVFATTDVSRAWGVACMGMLAILGGLPAGFGLAGVVVGHLPLSDAAGAFLAFLVLAGFGWSIYRVLRWLSGRRGPA